MMRPVPRSLLLPLLLLGHALLFAQGHSGFSTLVAPESLRQGDPLFVGFSANSPVTEGRLELRDQAGKLISRGRLYTISHDRGGVYYGAVLGLPYEAAPGNAEIRLSGKLDEGSLHLSKRIMIEARRFPSEDVPLDTANTVLRTIPDPKKVEEALNIQSIYARSDEGEVWMNGSFVMPVPDLRRSAGFGDRRRYLYASGGTDSIWHSGIDFAEPVGTPVLAPASGRVVYSGLRIVTGYTMVIEHLPGIYSVFMHLSKGLIPVGQVARQGEAVALSGNTGLSTGPHLHWEVRAGGEPVDPEFWLSRQPLDKASVEKALSIDFEGR
ncbi:MAG: M23 family metallopeptidase [Spirochaetota bacterium]